MTSMSEYPADAEALDEHLRSSESIPKADLMSWMKASDIEVLGVLYCAISEHGIVRRIAPALSNAEAHDFLRRYFGRCMIENPQSEWADSRYTAAWDAARWLKAFWRSLDDRQRRTWKRWLADLYKRSDAGVREAVETGLLEHIFPDRKIARYFSDWSDDPVLGNGYRMSLDVARGMSGRGRRW